MKAANSLTLAEYDAEIRKTWSEADLQNWVINYARGSGWLVAHFRGVRMQRKDGSVRYQTPVQADGAGFPDLVLVRGKRIVFAELKSRRGVASDAQLTWLAALKATPAEVYLWSTRTPGREIVEVLE